MAARPRKGATVYASRLISSEDIFPGVKRTYYISIPKGTKGKVTGTDEEDLLLVDFGPECGSWWVAPNIIQRTRP